MMRIVRIAVVALSLVGGAAQAQTIENPVAPGIPLDNHNTELDLPYWAPGRGIVNYDAIRRRALLVLERQFGAFRDETHKLDQAAQAYCAGTIDKQTYLDQFRAAWLAWAPLDSYQFGPIEQQGAALTVNFWPDKKNFVGRALGGLLQQPPEQQVDPDYIAQLSAGAQGLPAIEMLMYSEAQECPAVVGISGFLAQNAQSLYDGWFAPDGWADLARAAGPDNPVYLTDAEFTKTLYTALDFGLTRIAESRIARPLGTYQRAFPTRAEAWRSGLSDSIIHAQLDGIAEMIRMGFAGDVSEPNRAWVLTVIDQTHGRIDAVGAPLPEAVADPASRIRVEGVMNKVIYLQQQMAQDIGPNLGVETGFSAADGD